MEYYPRHQRLYDAVLLAEISIIIRIELPVERRQMYKSGECGPCLPEMVYQRHA